MSDLIVVETLRQVQAYLARLDDGGMTADEQILSLHVYLAARIAQEEEAA